MLFPDGFTTGEMRITVFCGMISVKGVKKRFGELEVLRGVNLEVGSGKMAALLGRSGSGKSTLLHILGALDEPDEGEISIDHKDLRHLKGPALNRFRNETVGFIFQFHHLLPEFSAIENVMIPGMILRRDMKEVQQKATALLHYLGLEERLLHKPSQLSGGEQQRVAVARALLNDPSVVLADEPTGNLDSHNAAEMHQLFTRLKTDFNITFLVATHSADLAAICDPVFRIEDGCIV